MSAPRHPRPLLARLLSPPGPPSAQVYRYGSSTVMAVPGRYSVSYLLLGEAVAVADCGSLTDVSRVVEALEWLGRSAADVRWIIPTHLHFDHMMGVDALALRLGAEVALTPIGAAHVAGERSLRWPRRHHLLRALPTWPMQGMPFLPAEDWQRGMDFGFPWAKNQFRAPTGLVLRDGDAIEGLDGWTALETPGHADEALCLYHEAAGWLVAGDTLRNFLGGEWNQLLCDHAAYQRTRARLAELDVRLVFPGHGPAFRPPHGLAGLPTLPWYMP